MSVDLIAKSPPPLASTPRLRTSSSAEELSTLFSQATQIGSSSTPPLDNRVASITSVHSPSSVVSDDYLQPASTSPTPSPTLPQSSRMNPHQPGFVGTPIHPDFRRPDLHLIAQKQTSPAGQCLHLNKVLSSYRRTHLAAVKDLQIVDPASIHQSALVNQSLQTALKTLKENSENEEVFDLVTARSTALREELHQALNTPTYLCVYHNEKLEELRKARLDLKKEGKKTDPAFLDKQNAQEKLLNLSAIALMNEPESELKNEVLNHLRMSSALYQGAFYNIEMNALRVKLLEFQRVDQKPDEAFSSRLRSTKEQLQNIINKLEELPDTPPKKRLLDLLQQDHNHHLLRTREIAKLKNSVTSSPESDSSVRGRTYSAANAVIQAPAQQQTQFQHYKQHFTRQLPSATNAKSLPRRAQDI